MPKDDVLIQMSNEVKRALIDRGLDPKNPPTHSAPPADAAFAEYTKRGGHGFADANEFIAAFLKEIGR